MTTKGGKGNDTLIGGCENDKIKGGKGNDTLIGGYGNDKIKGGKGNDKLIGGPGNDKLKGGAGNDVIIGGAGLNEATGNGGSDTFVISSGDGYTNILDFNENEDKLKFETTPSGVSLEIIGGNTEIVKDGNLMAIIVGRTDITMTSDSLLF